MTKMTAMPKYGKNLKNLLLQNTQGSGEGSEPHDPLVTILTGF